MLFCGGVSHKIKATDFADFNNVFLILISIGVGQKKEKVRDID